MKILSRLGEEFYVEDIKDQKKLRFTIPKENVLSWSTAKDLTEHEKGNIAK